MINLFRFWNQVRSLQQNKLEKIFLLCSFLIISVSMLSVVYWLYLKISSHSLNQLVNPATPLIQQTIQIIQAKHMQVTQLLTPQAKWILKSTANYSLMHRKNWSRMSLTRDCFEYFISQYGERNIDEIRQNFQRYIAKGFQASEQQQIQELWSRYLSYREQLRANCRWISLLRKVMAIFRQSSMQCMT